MYRRSKTAYAILLTSSIVVFALTNFVSAQGYSLSDLQFLPGDLEVQTSVRLQDNSCITAGGPGYLVVWEDERTVLLGYMTAPTSPLMGNQRDIYAARLDSAGNLLDTDPIIVSSASLNQSQPELAWNGQNWLVVWETERADWYFFQDIVGVRVSPQGIVLDSIPISIRLENNSPSNDYGRNPSVASDGTNWVVVWEDQTWQGYIPYPNVVGTRIAPDGTILDDPPILFYEGTTPATFGPILPQMRWASDEFLLVWEHSGYYQILGKRFTNTLQAIDLLPITIAASNGSSPRLASNGTDFFVVTREQLGYRVTHDGSVLDPNGISFAVQGAWDRGPDISWDGRYWVAGYNGGSLFHANMYLTRITTSGTLAPPGPTQIQISNDDQYNAAVASLGNGSVQVAWEQRAENLEQAENIRSVRVDADWSVSQDQNVSTGLHRQAYVRFATNGNEHLAVFMSQGGGLSRILTQRVDASGIPLDSEPVVISTLIEGYNGVTGTGIDVAFNGSNYLIVWNQSGSVYGRRLQPDGTLLDPAPMNLLTDAATDVAVAALGNNYYLVYTYVFSGDQSYLKGVRIDGNTLSLIGSPTLINSGSTSFALNPVVRAFNDQWFVVWEAQITHDLVLSSVRGLFVTPDGVASSHFAISTSGDADNPDVAIGNNRAFITWHEYTTQDSRIRARLMNQDGSFVSSQFLVNDALNRQFYPAAAWDGTQFIASWNDYRSLTGIVDQLRGDIFAARVSFDGMVIDADGIQLTSGPLPEDLSAAASAQGKTIIAFSKLHGIVDPEIQRIGYRVLQNVTPELVSVTLTPFNPPIEIPAAGGSFTFNIAVANNEPTSQTFDVWCNVTLPNGNPYGPVLGPINLTFGPGYSTNRNRTQYVPANAPAGIYSYNAFVGIYPNTIWSSDSFPFTKLGVGKNADEPIWNNMGDNW